MPIRTSERAKYPVEWPAIRARILQRANYRCEFLTAAGTLCHAPDRALVLRDRRTPEIWRHPHGGDARDPNVYSVLIVLTVAHLNHDPTDCRDENLRAGCQLHHLRHDAAQHAATRRARKSLGDLFADSYGEPE